MEFHHIGVAVNNLDKSIEIYTDLGYTVKNGLTYFDPIQNVNICFMFKENHPLIELISPHNDESPIIRILNVNGPTPYHTCYEVDSIEDQIIKLKKNGFIQISKIQSAIAFDGRKICFLINREIGLLELLQK
jgi:methylmalonyl-CoA/ethylmalonyl-CoA epimerase